MILPAAEIGRPKMRKWNESSSPLKPAETRRRSRLGRTLPSSTHLTTSSNVSRTIMSPLRRVLSSLGLMEARPTRSLPLEVQPAANSLRQRNALGNAQYSRPSDIAENSRILAAPNEAEKRKGGPPGRLHAPVKSLSRFLRSPCARPGRPDKSGFRDGYTGIHEVKELPGILFPEIPRPRPSQADARRDG